MANNVILIPTNIQQVVPLAMSIAPTNIIDMELTLVFNIKQEL